MFRPFRFRRSSFDRLPGTQILVADASDLGIRPGENFIGQIYPDAADAGILIWSDSTRRDLTFMLSEEVPRGDDGRHHWTFVPTPETIRAVPATNGWSVIIYND